jgi:glycosyltransferase involved in cell wall biosynthesis
MTASPTVRVRGKFISRDGAKLLLKAMRLAGVEGKLDLSEKLALRRRLDELASANLNTLILTAEQAESVLGVAGQAGLHALVEIGIERRDLVSREAARVAIARVAQTVSVLRGYPGLIGFVIDGPFDEVTVEPPALEALRVGLAALARTIHESHHGNELIALARHLKSPATAAGDDGDDQVSEILSRAIREDFTYIKAARSEPTDLGDAIFAMHRLAAGRPLVIEFGEELSGQVETVAHAFGLGAAGVVARAMRPAASPGWQKVGTLSAGELLPFADLPGSPQAVPMVSVVVIARDDERTITACLESIAQLNYPDYEVIVVDDGSRDRTAALAGSVDGAGRIRIIRERHAGMGAALNAGMRAARGHFVAFTRADCVVDEDWVGLSLRVITAGRVDACTGTIYWPAAGDGIAARAIASMTRRDSIDANDRRATLLNDRNMVVRKASLMAAGGFDGRFIDGGAEADLAARMVEAKMALGWSPASVVWCESRIGVGAYYRRRIGDGRAAAMLALKHPGRVSTGVRTRSSASVDHDKGIVMRGLTALLSISGALAQALAWHHYAIASAGALASVADAADADRDSLAHLPIAGTHAHPAHPHR